MISFIIHNNKYCYLKLSNGYGLKSRKTRILWKAFAAVRIATNSVYGKLGGGWREGTER